MIPAPLSRQRKDHEPDKAPEEESLSPNESVSFLRGFISANGLQGANRAQGLYHGTRENHSQKDLGELRQTPEGAHPGNQESAKHRAVAVLGFQKITKFGRSRVNALTSAHNVDP